MHRGIAGLLHGGCDCKWHLCLTAVNPWRGNPRGILFTDTAGQMTTSEPAVLEMIGSPSEDATCQFNVLTLEPLVRGGVGEAYRRVLTQDCIERAGLSYRDNDG